MRRPHVTAARGFAISLCLLASAVGCQTDDGTQGADGGTPKPPVNHGDGTDGDPASQADSAIPDPDITGPDGSLGPTGPITLEATFRTLLANRYLQADDAGTLAATAVQAPARFTLVDVNGGALVAGDAVQLRAGDLGHVRAENGGGGALSTTADAAGAWETFHIAKRVGTGDVISGERIGLSAASGAWVSAQDGGGGAVSAAGEALSTWETFVIEFGPAGLPAPEEPDFGDGTLVFEPSMSSGEIQAQLDRVFDEMESNHFGPERYALLFKPGTYDADVNVGFYTQVLGLGVSPDNTTIRGAVHAEADWFQGNATQNFWRGAENLAVEPVGGTNRWAVSQAAPFRRMHIRGDLVLDDNGWSSGGYLADSKVDGQANSGTQQQWLTRNSELGSWAGSNWNMVFVGVDGAPSGASWPSPPHTVVDEAPVLREKPFLTYDGVNGYGVVVPALVSHAAGTSWTGGVGAETRIPLSAFHVARAGVDTAATLNTALDAGKNLLFTPGIYHLDETLRVERAETVVLGLGLASLIPDDGVVAMRVADVDGVKVAGLLFDAGTENSPILMEVGPPGSTADHAANPTSLHDVFFRVGGAAVGKAETSLHIHSADVIGDHFWIWRADHGSGVGWNTNTAAHGLIVDGPDVTVYGLFVEHYQRVQTVWNADGGRVYFYQSEIPYDPPNQASWMDGSANGFAAYRVADTVASHQAFGLGIYCFFNVNNSVKLANAIEAPAAGLNGAMFQNMTTVSLGGQGEITHVIEGFGASANGSAPVVRLAR